MKLLFYFLFIVNILFANTPALKIAITADMAPYSYVDENNHAKGILVDYWKLWSKKTKIPIQFIPTPWLATLENIKEKKVDIHSGLFRNAERQKYTKYLIPMYNSTSHIYINSTNSEYLKSINDLDNKTLGLLSEAYYEQYIKTYYPNINVRAYTTYDELFNALITNEIDSLIDDSLITRFKLIKSGKFDNFAVLPDFEINKWFYAGVIKGNEKLEQLVIKGMDSIPKEEINKIEDKWIGTNNLENLNKNIFSKKEKMSQIFTKEELAYINKSEVLKVGIENWKPVISTEDGIKINGIAGEIVQEAFKISGLKIQLINDTWDVLLHNFENKKVDILPATYYTQKRSEYGLYGSRYITIKEYLYTKKLNQNIFSMSDLKGKKIAIVKNYGTIPSLKKLFPTIEIIETQSLEDSIKMVLNEEVSGLFDAEIVVETKIKEMLITTLKQIPQNEIKPNSLYVFSKKDDVLLQSILEKSLKHIPINIKNRIIGKWLNIDRKSNINIALGIEREPFIINNSLLKGIEHDLVKKILNKSKLNIKSIKNLPYSSLETVLKNDGTVDISVGIKEKNDGFFYSNTFINFENVVITRAKDNIFISNINDLPNYKIIAYNNAYKFSGKEYNKLFSPKNRPSTYKEISSYKQQIESFLENKSDMIIMDYNIFKWYFKQLGYLNIQDYKFDYIFPGKNSYKAAFRDPELRDIFNNNLQLIQKSGEYKKVIQNYLENNIDAKVKINSLVSSILSQYIYTQGITTIEKIVNRLTDIEYITKIEVFNNEKQLLFTSSNDLLEEYTSQNSYYTLENVPQKVGYTKIYFQEESLSKFINAVDAIPDIKIFNKLTSFPYIESIYKQFGYLDKKLVLSKKEQLFIKNNPFITFSSLTAKPLYLIENDKFTGLVKDYMDIIEDNTGLTFSFVKSDSWFDILSKIKNTQIDITPGSAGTKQEREIGAISQEYVNFRYAIVSNGNSTFIDGIRGLKDKILAIPKNSSAFNLIKRNYPYIKVIETQNISEALELVSNENVDAFIGHSAIATYYIKNSFPELKIIGLTEEKLYHHFLIQKNMPELVSILNKAISFITDKQKEDIRDKWVKTKINTAVDYAIIYQIIFIFILILTIILIFTKKLSKTKVKLEQSLSDLKNTQKRLVESEKMSSLGGLVAGVAHEINTPIGIGLTGATHFLQITKDIEKKYNDEDMTESDFLKYIGTSKEVSSLIYSNLKRTAQLVKSFKMISVDQTSEEKRVFYIKSYIDEILLSINNIVKKTNITIHIMCDENIKINSYPGAFSQIITNLILNSLIHGFEKNENGQITITCEKEIDKINISYKDNGKGISEENSKKIFDPFFTTNRTSGGSGLGLNIIYNIIANQFNGSIVCEKNVKKGVEFTIVLNEMGENK